MGVPLHFWIETRDFHKASCYKLHVNHFNIIAHRSGKVDNLQLSKGLLS